jgi:CRP-like cAMP-binding protein
MAAYVISPTLKAELDQLAAVVYKPKGTVLFRRGERGSGVFLVRKGKLALELDHASRIYPPRTLGPGSVAGLPAAVAGTAYSLTATVLEDSELGYIPRQSVVKLLGSNPALCLFAMKSVSREIARMRSAIKFS